MILVGGFLVLISWLVITAALILVGLPFVSRGNRRLDVAQLATAAWWGLLVLVALGLALAFFVPLHSLAAGVAVLITIAAMGTVGLMRARRTGFDVSSISRSTWVWLIGLGISIAFLAVVVMGPVTHYDAGLYQVSATRYAADYPVIAGLTNLYAPLGYGNAQPILAALTGIGPWGENGFRLVNGLFLVLLTLEATGRLLCRPRTVGTAVAIVAVALVFPPMMWMADFWVASPTPDVPTLVVTLVMAIYWAATLSGTPRAGASVDPPAATTLPTLVLLAGLLISLRPTMIPFALTLLLLTGLLELKRKNVRALRESIPAISVIAVLLILTAMRDRMLSGWWYYPLSVASFDVPWRAVDPTGLRSATLGFARNPEDFQSATTGWAWIGSWLGRLPDQWDPWWLLAGLLMGLFLLALARIRRESVDLAGLLYALVPFAIGIIVWFAFSPPAFRFGWGPLFGAVAIVLGWAVSRLNWTPIVASLSSLGLVLAAGASLIVKVDLDQPIEVTSWWGLEYGYVPLPTPEVSTIELESGIDVLVPVEGDQCWGNYPLCTPNPPTDLTPIGGTFDQGLVP